ncbi:unnamed protein product [Symbiodinium microadriaticum]|nr:unnamed protein product [Symbiodinium microadriaticum]
MVRQARMTAVDAVILLLQLGINMAMVDESGRYHAGSGMPDLLPPEPSDTDKAAAIDLNKQPVEKVFRLLYFELTKLDKQPPERRLHLQEFNLLAKELDCPQRLVAMSQESKDLADNINSLHLNATGTSGLYWTLHKYPEEHSWAWLLSQTQDRVMRKVWQYFVRLQTLTVPDDKNCMSAAMRTILMQSIITWKRMLSDHAALLWNSVAFGILGDVTSWRELDEDGQAANEPGGPPPNVSWSENLIFGNMYLSSVHKFMDFHAKEVEAQLLQELMLVRKAEELNMRYDFSAGEEHRVSKDGVYSSFEYLRRQSFNEWPVDKGLLRGLLRHILKPRYGTAPRVSVGDFGAGGGQYSLWLNDTGLVEALALDATEAVSDITGGSVSQVDLTKASLDLARRFDWILCLDVVSLLPEGKVVPLLQNIGRHLGHGGLVLSWGPGADEKKPPEKDRIKLVEREALVTFDPDATSKLKSGCEMQSFVNDLMVFRAKV